MSFWIVVVPAFLAGVAAACLDEVFRDMGRMMGHPNGLPWAAWIVIALVASLGAARLAGQFVGSSMTGSPSILSCFSACALGGLAVVLLPAGWLRLLGGAGLLWIFFLGLALLAGLIDIGVKIGHSPRS